MSTEFNVNRYWLERGRTYSHEERLGQEYHRIQERFLLGALRQGQIPTGGILELGCGFGRVTRLLAENFPDASITALDLSPDQLENARRNCAHCGNVLFASYDFYAGQPFPGSAHDLAMAIEVFLHHPRPVVAGLIQRLAGISRHIVSLDWSEDWPWQLPEHVWLHDYPALFADCGLQCVTLPLPQKVDGKQQKLFVAGRELSPAVIALAATAGTESRPAEIQTAGEITPGPNDWSAKLALARQEIMALIPTGGSFILVDDDQWAEAAAFPDRRVFPFLEKDGCYWGAPADDATALRELERLRGAGAKFIAFAWPAFWWFDHYAGLREHLAGRPCVMRNDRLVVFKLNP